FVWQPTARDTKDVFQARRALEGTVIDMLAAQAPDARALESLYAMVERERQAYERGDRISWIRLSNAFHVEMARLLNNQVLVEILHSLCARTTLIIAHYDTPGHTACSWHEHAEILDHLRDGDGAGAKASMQAHLDACEQRMADPGQRSRDPWTVFHLSR
ncbi:MAG TPA: GntR family transcriptional regulator, partial [Burkholderiaceae bacterium]|nr:GntR family transcriptional regulator [Burkholderiaceae bacterium]